MVAPQHSAVFFIKSISVYSTLFQALYITEKALYQMCKKNHVGCSSTKTKENSYNLQVHRLPTHHSLMQYRVATNYSAVHLRRSSRVKRCREVSVNALHCDFSSLIIVLVWLKESDEQDRRFCRFNHLPLWYFRDVL